MQKIRRALRVARGSEDRALVIAQDRDPVGDIGGVVVANLRRKFEIGRQERRAKLGIGSGGSASVRTLLSRPPNRTGPFRVIRLSMLACRQLISA